MARIKLDASAWDIPGFGAAFHAAQREHIARSLAAERRAWREQLYAEARADDRANTGPTFGADLVDLTAESDGAE